MPANQWKLFTRGYDAAGDTLAWEHSTTRGDAANPAADVQLVPPFRYSWEHDGGYIPGRLTPATFTVTYAATSRATLPKTAIGDILEISLYGSWWPSVENEITKTAGRVSDIAYSFDPEKKYPVTMTVTAADTLADNEAITTATRPALDQIRAAAGQSAESAVNLGQLLTANTLAAGIRVMLPNALPKDDPARAYNGGNDANALEHIERALNSAPIGGQHLAIIPRWNCGPWPANPAPTGYWETRDWQDNPGAYYLSALYATPTLRPATIAQPHDRQVRGEISALFTLTLDAGVYTLAPRTPDPEKTAALALIDAHLIDVPANATALKTNAPTIIDIDGGTLDAAGTLANPWPDRLGTVPARIDQSPAPITRPLPTALDVARDDRTARPLDEPRLTATAARAAAMFAHQRAPAGTLAFDRFTIRGDRIPTNPLFMAIFRRLTPRPFQSLTNRGHLVAPVVIHNLAPTLDMPRNEIRGYLTAGEITIDKGGEAVYTATLAPAALEIGAGPGVYGDVGPAVTGIVTYADAPPAWTFTKSAAPVTFEALTLTKVA